jgi:hypothetical protein
MWMMRYVVEHCEPRTPAIDLYVNRHYRELWEQLPERLKQEYADVQTRLGAGPNPAGAGRGRPEAGGGQGTAKRKTGLPRKGESG